MFSWYRIVLFRICSFSKRMIQCFVFIKNFQKTNFLLFGISSNSDSDRKDMKNNKLCDVHMYQHIIINVYSSPTYQVFKVPHDSEIMVTLFWFFQYFIHFYFNSIGRVNCNINKFYIFSEFERFFSKFRAEILKFATIFSHMYAILDYKCSIPHLWNIILWYF